MVSGYSVWEVNMTGSDNDSKEDYFVGMINGKLHLLGSRPQNLSYLFPERECINGDCGVVILPQKRKSIDELVKGDTITIVQERGKEVSRDEVIYLGKR